MHEVRRDLVGEQPDERGVQDAGAHLIGHVPAAGVLDGDLDGGMPPMEVGQREFDHRRRLARAADHAEPQPPRHHAGGRGQFAARQCMFAGGILVTPLLALGGSDSAVPMAAVVAGGALAALLTTVLLTRTARSAAQQESMQRASERNVAVSPASRGR